MPSPPGVVVLDDELRPVSWTAGARAWIDSLPAAEVFALWDILPAVIYPLAALDDAAHDLLLRSQPADTILGSLGINEGADPRNFITIVAIDERTIADALGQETIEMARHYAKGADLKPKMRGVVKSFEAELDKRKTKIVKPAS